MQGEIQLNSSFLATGSLLTSNVPASPNARRSRLLFSLATSFIFTFTAVLAQAKDYTRIVVFGDSLSDTGNMAHLYADKFNGLRFPGTVADYTDGRFTDGSDTIPPAQKYFGVWVEQFAASMPSRPEVKNSLDGGTNYSYAFAFTGDGTALFYPDDDTTFSVNVSNMGQQISDYLATKPKINNSTLFVIWGGANDLINATSPADIVNAAVHESLDIQRLVEAGATQFLVLNLPPLGLTPRLNGSPATSVPATAAAMLFNSWLATGLSVIHDFYPGRHVAIFQVDTFSLFNQIVAAPGSFSLANFTTPSQGDLAVDPDTYLFWDDIHPTTRGHNILAITALKAVSSPQCDSEDMPSCAAAH
jgi:phospholipase/lecithinase/hemolysin